MVQTNPPEHIYRKLSSYRALLVTIPNVSPAWPRLAFVSCSVRLRKLKEAKRERNEENEKKIVVFVSMLPLIFLCARFLVCLFLFSFLIPLLFVFEFDCF